MGELREAGLQGAVTPTALKARAFGRSLSDFGALNDAESKLVVATREGRVAQLGDNVPNTDEEREIRKIRAAFLRFLALGGDDTTPVHELGVRCQGAWIDGALDLQTCKVDLPIKLTYCAFAAPICLNNAELSDLSLEGSLVPEIQGDGLRSEGSVAFSNGFHATGPVRLTFAKIKENIDCVEGLFEFPGGICLDCSGAVIGGCIYLRNGFHAKGQVNLRGVRVGVYLICTGGLFENKGGFALIGDGADVRGAVLLDTGFQAVGLVQLHAIHVGLHFVCTGGRFDGGGEVALRCDGADIVGTAYLDKIDAIGLVQVASAKIGQDISFEGAKLNGGNGIALSLARTEIFGLLVFRSVQVTGEVSLLVTHAGGLWDDAGSWQRTSALALDGFRYDTIITDRQAANDATSAKVPVDAAHRVAWLLKQRPEYLGKEFRPQPWEQIINVLREMGHDEQARTIAIEKQKQLANAKKQRGSRLIHLTYGAFCGFGYRSSWILGWALVVVLICASIFEIGARYGVFGPADHKLYDSYSSCSPEKGGNWTTCDALTAKNFNFNALVFSLDMILPIIGFEQSKDWAILTKEACAEPSAFGFCNRASTTGIAASYRANSALGVFVWIVARLENMFGWIAGLMFVAAVSGFIKKD